MVIPLYPPPTHTHTLLQGKEFKNQQQSNKDYNTDDDTVTTYLVVDVHAVEDVIAEVVTHHTAKNVEGDVSPDTQRNDVHISLCLYLNNIIIIPLRHIPLCLRLRQHYNYSIMSPSERCITLEHTPSSCKHSFIHWTQTHTTATSRSAAYI